MKTGINLNSLDQVSIIGSIEHQSISLNKTDFDLISQKLEFERMDTLNPIEKVLELLQCPECRQGRLTMERPAANLRCEYCEWKIQSPSSLPGLRDPLALFWSNDYAKRAKVDKDSFPFTGVHRRIRC